MIKVKVSEGQPREKDVNMFKKGNYVIGKKGYSIVQVTSDHDHGTFNFSGVIVRECGSLWCSCEKGDYVQKVPCENFKQFFGKITIEVE